MAFKSELYCMCATAPPDHFVCTFLVKRRGALGTGLDVVDFSCCLSRTSCQEALCKYSDRSSPFSAQNESVCFRDRESIFQPQWANTKVCGAMTCCGHREQETSVCMCHPVHVCIHVSVSNFLGLNLLTTNHFSFYSLQ